MTTAILVPVAGKPEVVQLDPARSCLPALQALVGGDIESVPVHLDSGDYSLFLNDLRPAAGRGSELMADLATEQQHASTAHAVAGDAARALPRLPALGLRPARRQRGSRPAQSQLLDRIRKWLP